MRGWRYQDLTGKRFGSRTVLGRAENQLRRDGKNYYVCWECACDCGKTYVLRTQGLKCASQCRSCLGHSRKPRFGPRDAVLRELLSNYKSAARRRNLEWSLTPELFFSLAESRCHFCGESPALRANNRVGTRVHSKQFYAVNGIDRLNNIIGYTELNSVPCCETCNRAKLMMSREEYISHCRKVVANVAD